MLRLIILLISISGYYLFYRTRLKLSPYFFPITFISFASVTVYLGGLCNRLKEGGYAVIIIGLTVGAFAGFKLLRSGVKFEVKPIIIMPELWIFMILLVWASIITGTMTVSHADDFGHWYRICRIMNYDGSFIDAPDLVYRTYVPGTAVWIFFVTRFTGFSVHKCFFAQSLIYIACGISLFCVFEKKKNDAAKIAGCLAITALYAVSLAADVGVYELLVDTAVATVSFSELLLAVRGKGKKEYAQLLMIMSFAALIKTSAILFCFFAAAAWVISENRKRKGLLLGKAVIAAVIPLLFNCMYKLSLNLYHDTGNTTGNLSVHNLMGNFSEKTPVHLKLITGRYLAEIFRVSGGIAQIRSIWICLTVLFLAALYYKKQHFIWALIYSLTVSAVYLMFLYLTYLFSLSAGEALELVCLYRYVGTLTIFIFDITVISFISYINDSDEEKRGFGNALVLAGVVLIGTTNFDTGYIWGYDNYVSEEGYTDDLYEECVRYVPENIRYTEEKSIVIWDPSDFTEYCDEDKLPAARIAGMHLRSNSVLVYSIDSFTDGSLSDEEVEELNKFSCFYTIGDFSDEAEDIRKYLKIPHRTLGKTI